MQNLTKADSCHVANNLSFRYFFMIRSVALFDRQITYITHENQSLSLYLSAIKHNYYTVR